MSSCRIVNVGRWTAKFSHTVYEIATMARCKHFKRAAVFRPLDNRKSISMLTRLTHVCSSTVSTDKLGYATCVSSYLHVCLSDADLFWAVGLHNTYSTCIVIGKQRLQAWLHACRHSGFTWNQTSLLDQLRFAVCNKEHSFNIIAYRIFISKFEILIWTLFEHRQHVLDNAWFVDAISENQTYRREGIVLRCGTTSRFHCS